MKQIPSIEYALDEKGNKVLAKDAIKGLEYSCPYCQEELNVCQGSIKDAYFDHKNKSDRTPLERICPGYKGNEYYVKITNPIDKIYIQNGGIPLYLAGANSKFEIRAYFPILSKNEMEELKKNNAKICVNYDAPSGIEKAEYSVNNINYFKIVTLKSWVNIGCIPKLDLPEMKRKWLWGIRGIDLKNDIYHSNKDGGYRVAIKSNIYLGKEYRMLFEIVPPNINGVDFENIGIVWLKKNNFEPAKSFDVYSFFINSYTEESRSFIESKGYQLLKSKSELIPLWPPAVFEGKDLKFKNSKAFFLHNINKANTEVVKVLEINNKQEIYTDNSKIITIATENKTLIVSSSNNNGIIKYHIKKVNRFVSKKQIKLDIDITDSRGNKFDFFNNRIKPPRDERLDIKSNLPFRAIISNGNYVKNSSTVCFEKINYLDELIIDNKAFGVMKYKYKKSQNEMILHENNFEEICSYLYRCTSPMVNATTKEMDLLYLIGKKTGKNNNQLYRLIEYWVKTNKIPISAKDQLNKLRVYLGE